MRLFALAAMLAGNAVAQTADIDQLAKETQYPGPVNTFEALIGHKRDYRDGGTNESYRRITYKGKLVRNEGTPFRDAAALDLAAPALAAGAGDRNDLSLRYEEGTAKLGGGLFEAVGVEPIRLRALEALELRGTAFVGGDTDGNSLQVAVGVETAPFRLPGFRQTQWSNWLVLGLNAQRQEQTDTPAGDTSFGLMTYRAFIGKAFGWRKSGDVTSGARKLADEILRKVPNLETAKTVAAQIEKTARAGHKLTSVQQLIYDAAGEARSDAEWETTVRKLALGDTQALAERPTYAVYAEASGWRSAGRPFGGGKSRSLLTLTADYWFVPQRDDIFLRARYENGYERATPTQRKNQLLVSVGLKF